jgi:hypothetical protein
VVSGYGLYDRAIEVRSLAEAKGLFLYVRFQVLTAASMMFRAVFWVVLIPDDGGSTHL